MIDVFLTHKRFLEISEEADRYGSMDAALNYLLKWCEKHCKFFYIGQRGYRDGELGFEFRFAVKQEAIMFKVTWG